MLRRFVIVGLAAALAAPAFAMTTMAPASAAILFTCPGVDEGVDGSIAWPVSPGLSHTQRAQDVTLFVMVRNSPCSNGETFAAQAGTYLSHGAINPVTTFGPRPLGCPVAWGGAGPDYPDQTPILLGATDPSLSILWESDNAESTGIAKVKQGAAGDQWRIVFNITAGKYAPPAGQKTKVKGTVNIEPSPTFTYSCANDSDPSEQLRLASTGPLIVQQK